MISEKYLAGMIDGDGFISVRARKNATPDLIVGLSQREPWREVVDALAEMFDAPVRLEWPSKSKICSPNYMAAKTELRARKARKALERLKKYMVGKRHLAEQYTEIVDGSYILRSDDDIKAIRAKIKRVRDQGSLYEPNYPSRKWMAGFVDADGTFAMKVAKNGLGFPKLAILSDFRYLSNISLLHKAFGGTLQGIGQNVVWSVQLTDPNKCKQVLGHFAKYSIVKSNPARFLLGCAVNGNFRDGYTIRETLKFLNAQQHRLSDSAINDLIAQVDFNIPKNQLGRPRKR